MEKIHELEETINEKIKSKLTQIKENSQSCGNLHIFKEHILDNIKFQKIEHNENVEEVKQKEERRLEMTLGRDRYSLKGLRTVEHVPAEVNCEVAESTSHSRCSLLDAKSIDTKKGRFNRMRSPLQQGRLLKDKTIEEVTSLRRQSSPTVLNFRASYYRKQEDDVTETQ